MIFDDKGMKAYLIDKAVVKKQKNEFFLKLLYKRKNYFSYFYLNYIYF